jgi:hypothetical protein
MFRTMSEERTRNDDVREQSVEPLPRKADCCDRMRNTQKEHSSAAAKLGNKEGYGTKTGSEQEPQNEKGQVHQCYSHSRAVTTSINDDDISY